jgi:membrane protein
VLALAEREGRTLVAQLSLWPVLKNAGIAFIDHDDLTLSSALAFYVTLAFAPMIALSLWIAASLGGDAQLELLRELELLGGTDVRIAAQIVVDHAKENPGAGTVAGIVGVVVLIVSASAVFAQLQSSLNLLWKVKAPASPFFWLWLRHRLLSVGILAAGIFMLLITLLITAVLTWLFGKADLTWQIINQVFALAVLTVIFAGLFRYLPDTRIPIRHALEGGFITAALFALGKFLIGQYLAHSNIGGAYGPAGAFIVLLVWVYYSSAVFFFGAEIVGQVLPPREELTPAPYVVAESTDTATSR